VGVLRAGFVALAVSAIALAGWVDATGGAPATAIVGPVQLPQPAAPHAGAAVPGAIVEVPLASVPDPGPSSGGVATQAVSLAILPGPLELSVDRVEVELDHVGGGRWEGPLPGVSVVDARGSMAGWVLRWALAAVLADDREVPSAELVVEPGPGRVVAGLPQGLVAGDVRRATDGGGVLLAAEPGTGGGTYAPTAVVQLELPRSVDPAAVTVVLALTVG
jgi:hypothetical protein